MTLLSGPFNIQQGNQVEFVVAMYTTGGSLTAPSSVSMSITYTNLSNATQTDTITLSAVGQFFTGIWSSTSAALGTATWTATTSSSLVQNSNGQLRIIQRKGN